MGRSTKNAWLDGPGDLKTATVEDVPAPGESVLVQGLSAHYSNEAQSEATEARQVGRDQIISINVATLEALQFQHGCIDPQFTFDEAVAISKKYGPAFRKVIAQIDELSAIDKEALAEARARFPRSGEGEDGSDVGDATPNGGGGSDVPARAGGASAHDGPGADDR